MSSCVARQLQFMDWGVASHALAGQTASGDLHVVKAFERGVLLAAVDGVGHGQEAVAAAQMATAILEEHAQEPVVSLFHRCHEALALSRGVVMTLASVLAFESTLTWLGVGNVESRLLRPRAGTGPEEQSALLRPGVVGYQLPPLQASTVSLQSGDLLILATDGIRAGFTEELRLGQAPGQTAEGILNRHLKGTDDALVLVARYLGLPHE